MRSGSYQGLFSVYFVDGESRIVSNRAVSAQIARHTDIFDALRDVLPEVSIAVLTAIPIVAAIVSKTTTASATVVATATATPTASPASHSVREVPLILRVEDLDHRVCILRVSLKAAVRNIRKNLKLLASHELMLIKLVDQIVSLRWSRQKLLRHHLLALELLPPGKRRFVPLKPLFFDER